MLDRRAAYPSGRVVSADGVAEHNRRDPGRVSSVLGRAADLGPSASNQNERILHGTVRRLLRGQVAKCLLEVRDANRRLAAPGRVLQSKRRLNVFAVDDHPPRMRKFRGPRGAELEVYRSQVRYENGVRDARRGTLRPCGAHGGRTVLPEQSIDPVIGNRLPNDKVIGGYDQVADPYRR